MSGEADSGGGWLAMLALGALWLVTRVVLPVALLLALGGLSTRAVVLVIAFVQLLHVYFGWIARIEAEPDPVVQRETERLVRERLQRS